MAFALVSALSFSSIGTVSAFSANDKLPDFTPKQAQIIQITYLAGGVSSGVCSGGAVKCAYDVAVNSVGKNKFVDILRTRSYLIMTSSAGQINAIKNGGNSNSFKTGYINSKNLYTKIDVLLAKMQPAQRTAIGKLALQKANQYANSTPNMLSEWNTAYQYGVYLSIALLAEKNGADIGLDDSILNVVASTKMLEGVFYDDLVNQIDPKLLGESINLSNWYLDESNPYSM